MLRQVNQCPSLLLPPLAVHLPLPGQPVKTEIRFAVKPRRSAREAKPPQWLFLSGSVSGVSGDGNHGKHHGKHHGRRTVIRKPPSLTSAQPVLGEVSSRYRRRPFEPGGLVRIPGSLGAPSTYVIDSTQLASLRSGVERALTATQCYAHALAVAHCACVMLYDTL
jgi:hypothetical protein